MSKKLLRRLSRTTAQQQLSQNNMGDWDDNKKTRAFICLEVNDAIIKEVARVQELIGKKIFIGKFTELENLHLTLKFIGETDDETIEKVKGKLGEIKFEEFEASLGEIGIFSSQGVPRILWIKINGKDVWELQDSIDVKLEGLFKKEERFMSHMTMARVKYAKDKKGFVKHVKNIKVKKIRFKVNCFKLKKSELTENGPIYQTIEEYKSTNANS